MANALGLVDDPIFSRHEAPAGHPERPERLDAARAGLAKADISMPRLSLDSRDATDDELARVHTDKYLHELGQAAGKSGHFDADTYYAPDSVAAARRAAGGAVEFVDALLDSRVGFGLALLRPPGHHARPSRAMGFCLVNNVAVAAAHARSRGAERVLVLDWDVHHGNGTQEMFYADPSVLYLSLHQFPFYPGTGSDDEVGSGDGTGYTVNIPLSAGADDAVYIAAFDRIVCPIVEQYDPHLVLVSAGFDAHRRDPLAAMALSDTGYAEMTRRLRRAIARGAEGRLGIVLEGGYDLRALSESLSASLGALEGDAPAAEPSGAPLSPRHESELLRVAARQRGYWRLD